MKNKKEPFSQTGAYLSYVTVCEKGSAAVIRSIARLTHVEFAHPLHLIANLF